LSRLFFYFVGFSERVEVRDEEEALIIARILEVDKILQGSEIVPLMEFAGRLYARNEYWLHIGLSIL